MTSNNPNSKQYQKFDFFDESQLLQSENGGRSRYQYSFLKADTKLKTPTSAKSNSTIIAPLKSTPATQIRRIATPHGRRLTNYDSSMDQSNNSVNLLYSSIHKGLNDARTSVNVLGSRQGTPRPSQVSSPRLGSFEPVEILGDYNDSNKYAKIRSEQTHHPQDTSAGRKRRRASEDELDQALWSGEKWQHLARVVRDARAANDASTIYTQEVFDRFKIKDRLELKLRLKILKKIVFKNTKRRKLN